MSGSLVVVGTGKRAAAQTAPEAVEQVRRADRVVHVLCDPSAAQWLRSLNPTAQSLSASYSVGHSRQDAYREVTETLLEPVRAGLLVCFVTYGQTGEAVSAGHGAVRQARTEGHRAVMVPEVRRRPV
jgi:precorrin-3B methylase